MKLSELPQDIQQTLLSERAELHNLWHTNTPYRIILANEDGTRYFHAERVCISYSDTKGNYMPFGGGTYWRVSYGDILWSRSKKPMFDPAENEAYWYRYEWVRSNHRYNASANGTKIEKIYGTKKEVLALIKAIGIFKI